MITLTYKNKDNLLKFIELVNNDFTPKLSHKIDLKEFVDKILLKSILIVEKDKDQIKGLIVLYCNNESEKKAYISLCAVDNRYRGIGIASNLLKKAIDIVKKKEYNTIGIHSNNSIAIKMYQKQGFKIKKEFEQDNERIYLELIVNLK